MREEVGVAGTVRAVMRARVLVPGIKAVVEAAAQ
jgi:hypothetical protein